MNFKQALALADKIIAATEDGPPDQKAEDYFESVREGAAAVRSTIEENEHCTPGQATALANWYKGVTNWTRHRRY